MDEAQVGKKDRTRIESVSDEDFGLRTETS